jgi:hypothetical protein
MRIASLAFFLVPSAPESPAQEYAERPMPKVERGTTVPASVSENEKPSAIRAPSARPDRLIAPEAPAVAPTPVPGPNLVRNGGFEDGAMGPDFWQPLRPPTFTRVEASKPHGKVLRFEMPNSIAISTGLKFLGDPIPVEEGKTYYFAIDIRSEAPSVIMFIKGYSNFRGREREIYNRKKEVILDGKKGDWTHFSMTLTPQSPGGQKVLAHRGIDLPHVEFLRVQLYTYLHPGIVDFDNVWLSEAAEGVASAHADRASSTTLQRDDPQGAEHASPSAR